MEKQFSKMWKSSKQPRKQRKYQANAPNHIKKRMVQSHLTKELREKHGKRSTRVKKGDKVKVLTGSFRGKTGEVERIDIKNLKVFISKVEYTKKDGSKTMYPIHASNVMITELNMNDKRRKEKLTKKEQRT
jgi:large subunit ribosomal protein L24